MTPITEGIAARRKINLKLLPKIYKNKIAKSGPTTTPRVSKAQWNPNDLPRLEGSELSVIKASRAEVLVPFPNRSINLAIKTCGQLKAKPKIILEIVDNE